MRVEFFGVPRERAGVSELDLEADTLGQMLNALVTKLPSLEQFIGGEGADPRLHPAFIASLNGDRFVSDPATPLTRTDHVLILSADAGG